VIQGEAGLMDVTGFPDGEPTRVGIAITDYLAGHYAMQGILLALLDRGKSGLGQHVDIALFDSMLSVMHLPVGILLATGASPGRRGNDHPSIAPYETLRARDGRIIVAVANPRLWRDFLEAIGRPELADDPRFRTNTDRLEHRAALKAELERVFAEMPVAEIEAKLGARHVPCGRVRTVGDAIADPQVAARDMMLVQAHDALGEVRMLGNPVKLSRTPAEPKRPPPALGEHTREVLDSL
jgi:crotonobetainyl-CoA:carnitine CoA-transferase CaiB-like acyl-CoA transferase